MIIITPYIVPSSGDLTTLRTQLSQLKTLEDKYTKDLTIRLEERKLKIQKDTIDRERAIASIKAEEKELEEKHRVFSKSSTIKNTNSNIPKSQENQLSDEELYNQQINDIFGL